MSSQQEQLEAISHVMGWCPATNHDACWYEMTLNEIKSKYEKPRLFEDEIDRELQVKQSEAITALIQEARADEVHKMTADLVSRDSVLNEKHILHTILNYETERCGELANSGGSNNE